MISMKPSKWFKPACVATVLALGVLSAARAQVASPPVLHTAPLLPTTVQPTVPGRWQNEFKAFAEADRQQFPAPGGVLFVGSSTIRFWTHLAQDFSALPVVLNRGFGGSTLAECSVFAHDLVVRYKPRQVLVYAGDNDLAEGRTPLQVLESFALFANGVRAELPDTRISFISIKPSPAREALMPKIRESNNIIAAYLRTLPNSDYIDIHTPMIGADGRPRPELFRADRLHMNDEGYRLWQSVIVSHLPAVQTAGAP